LQGENMPLNIPSGTTNNISFGPAVVLMGSAADGTAVGLPTTDVGFIGEDGVTVELAQEVRNIRQGNPALINYSFYTQQSCAINFTSIEWDFDNFSKVLGATYATGSPNDFGFGGKALATLVGLRVQHYMAVTGHTMNLYVWKAQSESSLNFTMGQDEHQFPFSFNALDSGSDFGGTPVDDFERLVRFNKQT
jgi:hypothetical protein